MKRKVIATRYLPTFVPFQTGFILWLVLDRVQAPGWVWGVLFTMYVAVLVGAVALALGQDRTGVPVMTDDDK